MADAEEHGPASALPGADGDGKGEAFLSRWSRLKREARERPVETPQARPAAADTGAPPPELPPLDQLTFDSDYRQFFHPGVEEGVRRAALKKLFSDPRFNVMDGLDVYIDDYSKTEPLPAAMLAGLRQAQNILKWAKGGEEEQGKPDFGQESVPEAAGAAPALEPPQTQPPRAGNSTNDVPAPVAPGNDSGAATREERPGHGPARS